MFIKDILLYLCMSEFIRLFSRLNDHNKLEKRVKNILNLKIGDKIRILGLSEVVGQDWDDDLVLIQTPVLYEDVIKLTFTYPSGKEAYEEVYVDLIEDITIL